MSRGGKRQQRRSATIDRASYEQADRLRRADEHVAAVDLLIAAHVKGERQRVFMAYLKAREAQRIPQAIRLPDGRWIVVRCAPVFKLRSDWKAIVVRRKGRMTGIRLLPPGSISPGSDTDRGRSLVRGQATAGSKPVDMTPAGSEAVRIDLESLDRVKAMQPYKLRSRHSGR